MRRTRLTVMLGATILPSLGQAQTVPAAPVAATLTFVTMQSSATATPRSRREMRDDLQGCTFRPELIPTANSARIAACDRALADPAGEEAAWERQAILLHHRAVWYFASGQNSEALASLDQSDAAAAGQASLVFDGSIGLANMMLRALLLDRTNRQDEAVALIERARAIRPYSLGLQKTLDRFELNITGEIEQLLPMSQRHLSADAAVAESLFYQHFLNGNLTDAAAAAELVRFGRPTLIGGWTLDAKDPELEDLESEISVLYALAYVRAALRDPAGSEAAFARVEQRLTNYVGPQPVPTPERRTVRPAVLQAWQARVGTADRLRQPAAHWRAAIEMRAEVERGAGPEVYDKPRYQPVRNLMAATDILRVAAQTNPAEAAEILQLLRNQTEPGLRERIALTPSQAIALLPEAETLSTYPRFGRAGDGIMINREAGYSQAPVRDGDIRTIRFGTLTGSAATADELVILAAATYAQREGVDSFLIVGRHLLQRRTTITGYFGGRSDTDSGSEGAVLAVLVDSNAVPPQWEAHRSRLIRVADVMATLGARQSAIEAQKAAQSRR